MNIVPTNPDDKDLADVMTDILTHGWSELTAAQFAKLVFPDQKLTEHQIMSLEGLENARKED